jgi:hypothetical protein
MNFEASYERRHEFFPEVIEINDGKAVEETGGFYSANLSQLWNRAEDAARNHTEGLFVWAYYKLLHRKAKQLFHSKVYTIKTEEISKAELKEMYLEVHAETEGISKTVFCCKMMKSQFTTSCDVHDSRYDCPDRLLDYRETDKSFILIIHDGGSSGIKIKYCPWCGTKLK